MAKFVLMLDVLTSLMILFGSCKVSGAAALLHVYQYVVIPLDSFDEC